jgi:hypothetical protein
VEGLTVNVTPPAPCEQIALYGASDGTTTRVPIPAGFAPQGMVSIYGRARFLVAVIAADDPRTDAEVVADALAAQRAGGFQLPGAVA